MQDILTFAIEAVTVGFAGFMVADFALRLAVRKAKPAAVTEAPEQSAVETEKQAETFEVNPDGFAVASDAEAALVDAHSAYVAQFWAVRFTDNVVPFERKKPATPNLQDLTPQELRKLCQERAIKCYHVFGRNKHLKKPEMIALLSA